MSTYTVGNITESKILSAYLEAKFCVSVPFGSGCAYDLIVDTGKRLLRVQVKTGRIVNGCVIYKARRNMGSNNQTYRPYLKGEVDYFAVWCPENGCFYGVPADDSLILEVKLRVLKTRNSQQKHIKWARDYSWEKHIAELRQSGATEQAKNAANRGKKACA